jgi:hypothetical protein
MTGSRMNLAAFRCALVALADIGRRDLPWLDEAEYRRFAEDPASFILACNDQRAQMLWSLVERRMVVGSSGSQYAPPEFSGAEPRFALTAAGKAALWNSQGAPPPDAA